MGGLVNHYRLKRALVTRMPRVAFRQCGEEEEDAPIRWSAAETSDGPGSGLHCSIVGPVTLAASQGPKRGGRGGKLQLLVLVE